MIWNIVYFLLVPFGAWVFGCQAALAMHNHPPVSDHVDLLDILIGAASVCVYLACVFLALTLIAAVLHVDIQAMLRNALCPLCGSAPVISPQ